MRRILALISLLVIPVVSHTGDRSADSATRASDSREVTQEFMQTLKGSLQQAIKDGGPVNAIAVCNDQAPAIAGTISDQKGWRVARTSLKVRSAANAPDDWERGVLEAFDMRLGQGEDPKTMEYSDVVEQDGKQVFRYMKAIPTADVCLVCHGEQIDAAVAAKIGELYPADQATGYKAGDIRGAFTISQPM